MTTRQHKAGDGRSRLSLRMRVTLWSAGWLTLIAFVLVLLINSAVSVLLDRSGSLLLIVYAQPAVVAPVPAKSPALGGAVIGGASPPAVKSVSSSASAASPAAVPIPVPAMTTQPAPSPSVHDLQARALHLLRVVSVGVLIAVVLLGSLGQYIIAGRVLRRVREMGDVMARIQSRTLGERIALAGPRDELHDLAGNFNAMIDRLEHAFSGQRRFVADVSHELRTPLAVLQTNLDVTADDPAAGLEEYRHMASVLRPSVQRLEHLIENLLLLARDQQAPANDTVVLGPLLEELLDRAEGLASQREVTLHQEGEAALATRGEPTLLTHLFRNLIENAILYNRPGGGVWVRLTTDGDWTVVEVADNGVGIPPAEQSRLFERFYRGKEARSRQPAGSGLGLALVQQIVQQHRGTVSVSSTPERGTTFRVALPRVAAPEPALASA